MRPHASAADVSSPSADAADSSPRATVHAPGRERDDARRTDGSQRQLGTRKLDLTGQRFGRLTLLRDTGVRVGKGSVVWLCRCDCGAETRVRAAILRYGTTRSCGCLNRDSARERIGQLRRTHGHTAGPRRTPEYRTWCLMIRRCENARSRSYPYYGARGIAVCPRWRASFEAFFADMGPKPSPDHTIDRLDNEKGYEPANCRWATWAEQFANMRRGGGRRRGRKRVHDSTSVADRRAGGQVRS